MEIVELKDKQGKVDIDLKIIYDESDIQFFGEKKVKSVCVVDINNDKSTPSAWLDLYNGQIDKFKFQDKIRVKNAYAKLIKNNSGQFRITNADSIERLE